MDPNSWRLSLNKIVVGGKRDTDRDRERKESGKSLQAKEDQEREGETLVLSRLMCHQSG